MYLTRITRIIKLLGVLQSGRGFNTRQLSEQCGVNRRTIFRDLEALREANVPVVFSTERNEYHIPGSYFLPPTSFTAEEAMAVMVLCHELGDEGQLPFVSPARSAAVKLENSLPGKLRDYLRTVARAVTIRLPANNQLTGKRDVYDQLLEAISQRKKVRIRYTSFAQEEGGISTALCPYQLFFEQRSWYVIGRSSLHSSVRMFNVGRIEKLEPLEDEFQIPANFSIDRFLGNAWRLIPSDGPDEEVVVRFSAKVARNVDEVLWHKTQQTETHDDGSLTYRATVSGLQEISWWILGYGDQAEVITPPTLRNIIRQRAEGMLKLYQDD